MLMDVLQQAFSAMMPYIAITMVFYYSGTVVSLIKKAVGVKG